MKKFLQNIVKLKKISTIKDFRFGFGFGIHFLPATSYDFREGRSRKIFYLVSCYRLFKWLCVMFSSAEDDEKDFMSGGKGFVYFTVL